MFHLGGGPLCPPWPKGRLQTPGRPPSFLGVSGVNTELCSGLGMFLVRYAFPFLDTHLGRRKISFWVMHYYCSYVTIHLSCLWPVSGLWWTCLREEMESCRGGEQVLLPSAPSILLSPPPKRKMNCLEGQKCEDRHFL